MIGFMLLGFGFLAGACLMKGLYTATILCVAMFIVIRKAEDYINDKL